MSTVAFMSEDSTADEGGVSEIESLYETLIEKFTSGGYCTHEIQQNSVLFSKERIIMRMSLEEFSICIRIPGPREFDCNVYVSEHLDHLISDGESVPIDSFVENVKAKILEQDVCGIRPRFLFELPEDWTIDPNQPDYNPPRVMLVIGDEEALVRSQPYNRIDHFIVLCDDIGDLGEVVRTFLQNPANLDLPYTIEMSQYGNGSGWYQWHIIPSDHSIHDIASIWESLWVVSVAHNLQ